MTIDFLVTIINVLTLLICTLLATMLMVYSHFNQESSTPLPQLTIPKPCYSLPGVGESESAKYSSLMEELKEFRPKLKPFQGESNTYREKVLSESDTVQSESHTVKPEWKPFQADSNMIQPNSQTVPPDSKPFEKESRDFQPESKTSRSESNTVRPDLKTLSSYPAVPQSDSEEQPLHDPTSVEHYTNEWIVHILGGVDKAKAVVEAHGHALVEELMGFKDHYRIVKTDHAEVNDTHSNHLTQDLLSNQQILWAEQQVSKRRQKRYAIPSTPEEVPPPAQANVVVAEVAKPLDGLKEEIAIKEEMDKLNRERTSEILTRRKDEAIDDLAELIWQNKEAIGSGKALKEFIEQQSRMVGGINVQQIVPEILAKIKHLGFPDLDNDPDIPDIGVKDHTFKIEQDGDLRRRNIGETDGKAEHHLVRRDLDEDRRNQQEKEQVTIDDRNHKINQQNKQSKRPTARERPTDADNEKMVSNGLEIDQFFSIELNMDRTEDVFENFEPMEQEIDENNPNQNSQESSRENANEGKNKASSVKNTIYDPLKTDQKAYDSDETENTIVRRALNEGVVLDDEDERINRRSNSNLEEPSPNFGGDANALLSLGDLSAPQVDRTTNGNMPQNDHLPVDDSQRVNDGHSLDRRHVKRELLQVAEIAQKITETLEIGSDKEFGKSRYAKIFNDEKWVDQWYLQDFRQDLNLPVNDLNVVPVYALYGYSGQGIRVVIPDDGLDHQHEDLKDNYDENISYDLNSNDADPSPRPTSPAKNVHGTRCAGEIAMVANNEKCGVGIAFRAKIGGIRMLDGVATDRVEGESLKFKHYWVDIYSNSWGPSDDGKTLDYLGHLVMQAMVDGISEGRKGRGALYVFAAGNGKDKGDTCSCDPYVSSIFSIAIATCDRYGHVCQYSERCTAIIATAFSSGLNRHNVVSFTFHSFPFNQQIVSLEGSASALCDRYGRVCQYSERCTAIIATAFSSGLNRHNVVTTDVNNGCTQFHTGTSAAAPLVAGILALLLEANPELTWRDVQHLIIWTSEVAPLEDNYGWYENGFGFMVSHDFGFGMINAFALITEARTWKNVPLSSVCVVPVEVGRIKISFQKLKSRVESSTFKVVFYVEFKSIVG
ncbi:hypothetical protein M8J77_005183 [Diaphorina citri]|nr:hypothetical protein M8J77_005183 [Diaphorina citri]